MSGKIRVALIGCGTRGQMFGSFIRNHPDDMVLVSLADLRDEYRLSEADRNSLDTKFAFNSFEQALCGDAPEADLAVIATTDREHFPASVMALKRGMDILLEKPVAHDPVLSAVLVKMAASLGRRILVQHELRYSPFFQKIREIVHSGRLGQIYSYQHTEHVEFWHMTHSFVRGNYNNAADSNPMIVAKCCHDLDLMPWVLGDEMTKVSSFGRLDHFRPENKPAGATHRCTDGCPASENCIYDAAAFYLGEYTGWPVSMVGEDMTLEARKARLAESPLSLCVYNGHNDVVDHQVVMMESARGTICTLTMEGFSIGEECGRKIRLDGTAGTLRGDMGRGEILIYNHWHGPMGTKTEPELIDLRQAGLDGHGGGDERLFDDIVEYLAGRSADALTPVADSLESHLLGWAAEQSRSTGTSVNMGCFRAGIDRSARAMMESL